MKKMVCAILAVFLLLLGTPLSASAAGTAKVTITPSSTTMSPGDTITFTVTVANCDVASSMGIIPSYDSDLFEFVSGEWLLTDAILADFSDGVAAIAYSEARNMSGDVLTFTLKVKENATLKSASVTAMVSIKNLSETVECSITPANFIDGKQLITDDGQSGNIVGEEENKFPVGPLLIGVAVCAVVGTGAIFAVRRKKRGE